MLDDLCSSAAKRSARRRFYGSIAVALLVHCGVGAAMLVTKATARHVVEDELTEIEIVTALPPEPLPLPVEEAPPADAPSEEQAAAAPAPRPRLKQPELAPPQEPPSEQPAEPAAADALLAEAGPTGPVAAGVVGGVIGGTGTAVVPSGTALVATAPAPAPPPRPEPLVPPVEQAGNPHPRYSLLAKRNGIEGLVVVTFEVLEDGRVASPRILSGPEELYESVLKAVSAWRFKPARRGQAAVKHKVTRQIRFRLEDA
jgi:protein TonB